MKYILNPSLEYMCLAKIAIHLWTEDDQLTTSLKYCLLANNRYFYYNSNVILKMRRKMEALPLQTPFKLQLASFIRPIAHQIYDWYDYLNEYYKVKRINLQDVRWTSYGTIDQQKSAQILLQRDQNLELKQRYRLACTFCLTKEIQELLREMPEKGKLPPQAYSSKVRDTEQDLVVFFTHYVRYLVNLRRLFETLRVTYLSPYHEACHVAILSRNPTATKYFFQRLSSKEKNLIFSSFRVQYRETRYLVTLLHPPYQFSAELVCFLLSRMSETQREEQLRTSAECVFRALVVWPYNRDFLLETINRMWEFVRESDFYLLIYDILGRVHHSSRNCEYRELYFELWRSSPARFRKYFVDRLQFMKLQDYFNYGEMEVCKLMLSEADARRKERMLLDDRSIPRYNMYAEEQLRDYFQFFVAECGTSRDVIVRFKTQLTADALYVDNEESREFFRFLDTLRPEQNSNEL